jgi:RNA polymerase sigma-70 factor, ECF subfamily
LSTKIAFLRRPQIDLPKRSYLKGFRMSLEPILAVAPCSADKELMDEPLLVEAARRGDEEAFACLFRRHSARTYRSILRILRDHEDAEDALQETFFKAFIHLHSFEGKAKFSSWLIRIAVNSALMELRKKRRRRFVQLGGSDEEHPFWRLELIDARIDIHSAIETAELMGSLAKAVSRLKPVLREMLELQLRSNCSQKELAAVANVSVPTVKARIFRARKALRISLGSEHEPTQKSKRYASRSAIAQ